MLKYFFPIKFESLLFSYRIFRLPGGENDVKIFLPINFWWRRVNFEFFINNIKYRVNSLIFSTDNQEIISFKMEDGVKVFVKVSYEGFFSTKTKTIVIPLPVRLQPATNFRAKILRIRN